MSPRAGKAEYFLEHLYAALTVASFAYVYWVMKRFDLDLDIQKLQMQVEAVRGIILAGTASLIAAIVFWIHMFRDYFRQEPERHAAAWAVFLLVGAHLAALVYFFAIWRPRYKPR